jgi:hypothetical protein
MHSEIRIGFRHQFVTKKLGRRAIVVVASIAGLMTARVLSEYFDQVLAIDRDEIEDRPVVHKSVPQGHHLHEFLQGGLNVVSLLYPAWPPTRGMTIFLLRAGSVSQ